MDDGDSPRRNGDAAGLLAGEDLSPYSRDELTARIALLEAEIARVREQLDKASAHRAAAEAVFGKAPPDRSVSDGTAR